MEIKEFDVLRPYGRIYVVAKGKVESVDLVDIKRMLVYTEEGIYNYQEVESEEYYIVNILNKTIFLEAELVVVDSKINSILDSKNFLKKSDVLIKLSERKTKILEELAL